MTKPSLETIYDTLLKWTQSFSHRHNAIAVDGEYYDQPGQTVYTTAKVPLKSGGRVEVSLTPAVTDFSWKAEITIDDAANNHYQHILLQQDGSIVETYGKQVIPIDTATATKSLERLKGLDLRS